MKAFTGPRQARTAVNWSQRWGSVVPVTCTLPRIAPPSSNTTASASRWPAVARTGPAGVAMVRIGLVMG
ncbi:hypothetical protein ACFVJK_37555 [Streptomyces sp. NPDC127172]|uniref:hypothetical protein n=1 Tax=Streptomyces sp. NPDC127172 TaxID=3345382 RepID=UPI003632293C